MRKRAAWLLLSLTACLGAAAAPRAQSPARRIVAPPPSFKLEVPAHDFDIIPARPEGDSLTLSVLAYRDLEGRATCGTVHTAEQRLSAGKPALLRLEGLRPDTAYRGRFEWREPGTQSWHLGEEFAFHTARPAGEAFRFTLTADVHLDEHTSPEVYRRTLQNIRADGADFHIDLGNLFMTDKHTTRAEAAKQYLAQRYYLGTIGSPIFLALGTHDGEAARYETGGADSLAAWSYQARTTYFPNPVPDGFYSGDATPGPRGELPQDYYAWEWGDALFVVLDPFRYSSEGGGRRRGGAGAGGGAGAERADGWGWSLGRGQYDWLDRTLAASGARYKFVFVHNLLSGDQAARGGVEVAGFNEWGGKNLDGSEGFAAHRPGWREPVHQLLLRHHVAAVFKAHDNFYARQQLDGLLYLMVPQPSFAGDDRIRDLRAYGYKEGVFLGNSGHVRVVVSPERATVEYVRSKAGEQNGAAADRCDIRPTPTIQPSRPDPVEAGGGHGLGVRTQRKAEGGEGGEGGR